MAILTDLFTHHVDLGRFGHIDAVAPARAESEEPPDAVGRWLLERHFTGTITDAAGRKRQYVDGNPVAMHHDEPADGAGARTPELSAEDTTSITTAATNDLPPAVAKTPGLVAKLKDAALTVGVRAYGLAARLSEAGAKIAGVLDAVLDTPSDMKKFGYNPTSAGGVDHANNDFVRMNLESTLGAGISGHLAAKIAATALSHVAVWAKRKLTGARPESESDGLLEVAGLVAEVLAHVNDVLGLEGAPDAATVAKALGRLL